MLFQSHFGTFAEYIQRAVVADGYTTSEAVRDSLTVEEFLSGLDIDVLRIMATIKTIGHQTGSSFVESRDSFSTYLYYEDVTDGGTDFDNPEEYYVKLIASPSWEYGRGYVFLQGLERLGIALKGVPDSSEIYNAYEDDGVLVFTR
jgi:hypothetical protein